MQSVLRAAPVVFITLFGEVGCVVQAPPTEEDVVDEPLLPAEPPSDDAIGESVQAVRTHQDLSGFTDCNDREQAITLIGWFEAIGDGVDGLSGALPWPFNAIVAVVGAWYWSDVAEKYQVALDAPGSVGVCVDWAWVPYIKKIYPWAPEETS